MADIKELEKNIQELQKKVEKLSEPDKKIDKLEQKRIYQGDVVPGAVKPRHLVAGDNPEGSLYYSDGTNFVNLGIGTEGQVLKMAAGIPTWTNTNVYKSSDETVNNSSTMQNDDELFFSIGANESYFFTMWMIVNSNVTADLKYTFTVPSGCYMNWFDHYYYANFSAGDTVDRVDSNGTDFGSLMSGVIKNGSTAGTIQLQWAQNTMNASDTKVLKGSHILLTKLI